MRFPPVIQWSVLLFWFLASSWTLRRHGFISTCDTETSFKAAQFPPVWISAFVLNMNVADESRSQRLFVVLRSDWLWSLRGHRERSRVWHKHRSHSPPWWILGKSREAVKLFQSRVLWPFSCREQLCPFPPQLWVHASISRISSDTLTLCIPPPELHVPAKFTLYTDDGRGLLTSFRGHVQQVNASHSFNLPELSIQSLSEKPHGFSHSTVSKGLTFSAHV